MTKKYEELAQRYIDETFGKQCNILRDNAYVKFGRWLDSLDSKPQEDKECTCVELMLRGETIYANSTTCPVHDKCEWVHFKNPPQKIELLDDFGGGGVVVENRDKINELVRAVNRLTKSE